MSLLFKCPLGPYLGGIAPTDCPIKWDQTQKVVFGRKDATRFPNAGAFVSQAHWQALLNATDDSRLVISTNTIGFVIPPTEVLSVGGNDNTTIGGVREITGVGFATVSFMMKNVSSETANELRQIGTETMISPGQSNIEVFLLQTDDAVVYNKTSTLADFRGFEIFNLVVTDIGNEGLNSNTVYNVTFDVQGGWSQYWGYQKLPFNPRELENPTS